MNYATVSLYFDDPADRSAVVAGIASAVPFNVDLMQIHCGDWPLVVYYDIDKGAAADCKAVAESLSNGAITAYSASVDGGIV